MRKKYFAAAVSAVLFSAVSVMSIGSSAATIEDVASTARGLGFPENIVQQGINEYYADPDSYTEADLDDAISYLYQYEKELKEQLGITDTPQTPDETQPETQPETQGDTENSTLTQQPSQEQTQGQTQGQSATKPNGSSDGSSNNNNNNQGGNSNTSVSAPSIPNRIEPDKFINMTLDEKRDYISSLPAEQQTDFFNSLSPEELNSVVKQLPTDDKAQVMQLFIEAGEGMGVNLTVDEMSDDKISMSMRNKNGELVDVASVGVIVENTGYDYRGIFALSGGLLLLAVGGTWLLVRKCFGKKESTAEDEQ